MKPHGVAPEPMARAVAKALAARPWARGNILVSSFYRDALAALRDLMPDQPLAMLYRKLPTDWPQVLSALGASSLHIRHNHLSADILAQARRHGFHVRVFTINDPALMEPFRTTGLTGVITDHPPLFLDSPVWAGWAAG
jgi:glycerophosphoryl diester phosphodiesterase